MLIRSLWEVILINLVQFVFILSFSLKIEQMNFKIYMKYTANFYRI